MLIILQELTKELDNKQTRQNDNQNQMALADTGNMDTIGNWELEAHYLYMAKIQEVILAADEATGPVFDKELLEHGDSNTTIDPSEMSNNEGEVDQDEQKLQEECALLA
ncbi:hypothetical protein Tco_1407027 [Tanacetum coccineum]